MSKILRNCISNLKTFVRFSSKPPSTIRGRGWLLPGFLKHPKTSSFAVDSNNISREATLKDINNYIFEHFNSLYEEEDEEYISECEKNMVSCQSPIGVNDSAPEFFEPAGEVGLLVDSARSSPNAGSSLVNGDHILNEIKINISREATLKDINNYIFENFNSVYEEEEEEYISECEKNMVSSQSSTGVNDSPPEFLEPAGDACLLVTNARSSPNAGSSSLKDDCEHLNESVKFPKDTYAILQYSNVDPYTDFWRSMVELVAAHKAEKLQLDSDYFTKLLLSYLSLNEKKAHKYIIGAFVELMPRLIRQESGEVSPESGR